MKIRLLILGIFFFSFNVPVVRAEVITLQNGDRLTASIIWQGSNTVLIHHDALGRLEVPRNEIKSMTQNPSDKSREKKKGDKEWKRKIGVGYEVVRGNTDYNLLNGDVIWDRNRIWIDQWTLKANGNYQKSHGVLNAQHAQASLRYAFSIHKALYNFYRIAAEHDYFQDLKLRLTPSAGLGYWFLENSKTSLLGESGLGYQFEFYRPSVERSEPILHTRAMFSHKLNEHLEIGMDSYYFPSLRDFEIYRFESEGFLKIPFSKRWAFNFKIQDHYHSRPRKEAKKNDVRLVSLLEYSF